MIPSSLHFVNTKPAGTMTTNLDWRANIMSNVSEHHFQGARVHLREWGRNSRRENTPCFQTRQELRNNSYFSATLPPSLFYRRPFSALVKRRRSWLFLSGNPRAALLKRCLATIAAGFRPQPPSHYFPIYLFYFSNLFSCILWFTIYQFSTPALTMTRDSPPVNSITRLRKGDPLGQAVVLILVTVFFPVLSDWSIIILPLYFTYFILRNSSNIRLLHFLNGYIGHPYCLDL